MTSTAKAKAAAFAKVIAQWDGPKLAAEMLFEHYAGVSVQATLRLCPTFRHSLKTYGSSTVRLSATSVSCLRPA